MFEIQVMFLFKIYSGPKIIVLVRPSQRIILISALIKMVFLSKTVAKQRLIKPFTPLKEETSELEISSAPAF